VGASVKSKGAVPEWRHRRKPLAAADALQAHVCKVGDNYPDEQINRIDALCAASTQSQRENATHNDPNLCVSDSSQHGYRGQVDGEGLCFLAERFGSGDGERKTLLTRQIAPEPLPASVLFGLVLPLVIIVASLIGCRSRGRR
jgi:hypothetical protein